MKTALSAVVIAMSLSMPAMAADGSPLKTCSTVIKNIDAPDYTTPTLIKIHKDRNSSLAVFERHPGESDETGIELMRESFVKITRLPVRAGLSFATVTTSILNPSPAEGEPSEGHLLSKKVRSMNDAERLIAHAIWLTQAPMFKGTFSVNFDLGKVRSAKVYQLGKGTHMGMTAIVEAMDESGKVLGSFFDWILGVGSCE